MKKILFKTLTVALTAIGLSLIMVACKEDTPETPAPVADFTFVVDGTAVTFTNTSTNGETYAWDFGDGQTSTEENPTNTYANFAGYVVTLTTTNSSGENKKQAAIEVVAKITIDGDFADWANIPAAATKNSNNTGAVNTIKVTSDLTHLYVYVDGTDALGGFVSMYFNSDNDSTTGWAPKNHVFTEAGAATETQGGADFEVDLGGPWPSDGSLSTELWTWLEDAGNVDQAEWSFEGDEVGSPEMFIQPVKTGNAYEFAIVRASFPNGLGDAVSFLFVDVDINQPPPAEDWIETGYLPNDYEGFISHTLFK